MRLKVVTVCAASLTTAALSCPAAIASGSQTQPNGTANSQTQANGTSINSRAQADGINVSPSVAKRGDSVTVTGGCQGGEHAPDTWASLTSPVLIPTGSNINSGGFSLTTTVRDTARFGRSTVTVTCNNSKNQYRASIFIKFGKRFLDDEWPHHPEDHDFPHTGGGGMAHVAQGGSDSVGALVSGLSGPVGLALLGGAVGVGGLTVLRSRARATRGRD